METEHNSKVHKNKTRKLRTIKKDLKLWALSLLMKKFIVLLRKIKYKHRENLAT